MREQRRDRQTPAPIWRVVLAACVAMIALAVIAQPVLSTDDDEPVVDHAEAARPGPQPKIVDELVDERTPTSRRWPHF